VTNVRASTRHDCELAVTVLVVGSASEPEHLLARNVSLGGAFLVGAFRPPFNARVRLSLTLPGTDRPIDVEGTVRWQNDEGFAVQFDGLRARDVWALGKFFEQG
jgi:hypothetical protein